MPPATIAVTSALYSLARLSVGSRVGDDLTAVLGRPPRSIDEFVRDHAPVWS